MFEEEDPIFKDENQDKLMKQIMHAPDCKIYGVSKYSESTLWKSMILTIMLGVVIPCLFLIFYIPLISIVAIALDIIIVIILFLIFSYLRHAHTYFKLFVSDRGIAKEAEWHGGAFPWEKIEYIEVKNKGNEIDYIVFRVGRKKIGYRASFYATRLSLEIVSEFIGGIDNWHLVEDLGEASVMTEGERYYMNPDIDKSEGQKRLEEIIIREWVGDQDYDAGQTQEQLAAKTDDELYELIQNDPQCVILHDTGKISRIFGNFKIWIAVLVVSIPACIVTIFLTQFAVYIFTLVIIAFALIFYTMFKGDEKLVLSPIGIARFLFGSLEALEWQHVEYIDFHTYDSKPVPLEFFGNRRRIFCPEHTYKDKFAMELVLQFIPNLSEWTKISKTTWEEGTFRLTRPET